MADLMPLALEFARAFNKSIRSFRMYSPAHPQVQVDLKESFGYIEKMLLLESPVVMGSRDGVMIIQGRPVTETSAILKSFCDALAVRTISAFSVQKGATPEEFRALVDILVRRPEDVKCPEGIKPELLKPLKNIRLNELRFVALQDGVSDEAMQALASGGEKTHELLAVLDAFVKGGIAPAPGSSGPRPPSGVSDSLSRIINSGAAGELVGMMDGLVKQLDAAGIGADERGRKMSQLFKLLPVAEQVQRLRPVLVVEEEADVLQRWIAALDEAGYEAEGRPTIETAMEALRGDTPWAAVVVDLGFRAAESTAFLAELGASEVPTPLILTAWDEAIKDADAVQAHPSLKFLLNPVESDALIKALDEIVPPPEIPKPTADQIAIDPKLARELERANEIQAGLLPKEVPQVAGFELAGQYLPAEHVGGDYWDVIPLKDGRVGMLVADVSGKGISAAMVMVMARTVFHAIAPGHASARSCVIEAAQRIAADLPGGTFITLCYAVLTPATGEVSVANCGHIPPLHWSLLNGRPFVSTVDSAGGAIGLVRGPNFERTLRDGAVTLGPLESLVFFTDGINEAMSETGEEFGDQQVHKTVKKNGGGTAEELAQALVDAVLYHRGDAPASDDVTVLVIRRGPKGPEAWEEPIELT